MKAPKIAKKNLHLCRSYQEHIFGVPVEKLITNLFAAARTMEQYFLKK